MYLLDFVHGFCHIPDFVTGADLVYELTVAVVSRCINAIQAAEVEAYDGTARRLWRYPQAVPAYCPSSVMGYY